MITEDTVTWLPCSMCGWMPIVKECTCEAWLDMVQRHRMERDEKARHRASVSLAMSRVVIGKAAA